MCKIPKEIQLVIAGTALEIVGDGSFEQTVQAKNIIEKYLGPYLSIPKAQGFRAAYDGNVARVYLPKEEEKQTLSGQDFNMIIKLDKKQEDKQPIDKIEKLYLEKTQERFTGEWIEHGTDEQLKLNEVIEAVNYLLSKVSKNLTNRQ